MARPVTMFTGQWADLPLETLAQKVRDFGYDGLELACWGDHFEVQKALEDPDYCARKRDLLDRNNLQVFAISAHLVGQAVLDNIDARHQSILPPYIWGDGEPAGVNDRAAEELKDTARAAQKLGVGVFALGDTVHVTGVTRGRGFTGGMKRWGWHGGPGSHGSMTHRRIGSLGSGTTPGRPLKGRTQAGHYGVERVTVRKLSIVKLEPERGVLHVSGAIPGHRGSLVLIRKA